MQVQESEQPTPQADRRRSKLVFLVGVFVGLAFVLVSLSTAEPRTNSDPRVSVRAVLSNVEPKAEKALLPPATQSESRTSKALPNASDAPNVAPLGAFDPVVKSYFDVLAKIRLMSDADLYPRMDAPREVRLKAGAAVCFLGVTGMPHVCGTQRRPDLVEACARHWGAKALELALPEKCRDLPYWRDVVAPAFPNPDPEGAQLGPLTDDPFGKARMALIDDFCKDKACPKHPRLGRDYVLRSSVHYGPPKPRPYVPPSERVFRKDLPIKECTGGSLPYTAYPINFGIVEELIAPKPYADRVWDFFPFLRLFDLSKWDPYKMGERDEFVSHEVYRRSFFGFTHRRGGWDCFRHYELLAAGSLPYFADLAQCDKVCLAGLPKDLLEEAMNLPGVKQLGRVDGPHKYSNATDIVPVSQTYFAVQPEVKKPTHVNARRRPIIDWAQFDRAKYDALVEKTLDYTRKYLTTKSVVSYLLHRINYEEPKHVLLIARDLTDYMEMTVEHGLASLGIKYTTNQDRPHGHQVVMGEHDAEASTAFLDEQRTHRAQLWRFHGRGLGYGIRIPPLPADHNSSLDSIRERLRKNEFDLVIYSYLQLPVEQQTLWEDVSKHVPKERIVIVCGNDNLGGGDWVVEMFFVRRLVGHLFRRELEDFPCR